MMIVIMIMIMWGDQHFDMALSENWGAHTIYIYIFHHVNYTI